MHSNKIGAFFFFFVFIILVDGLGLRTDYYRKSCPDLQNIVWNGVVNATNFNQRMPASLLRLQFHDCFVLGCDASLLLDGNQGEQFARPNLNSILGLDVIDNIKAAVEKKCPNTVSCADILALVARDAVQKSYHKGSLYWHVPLGRLDGWNSSQNGANREIPAPFDTIDTIINKFKKKGLSVQDVVALSGAHTIGMARCFSFKNRLYQSNSTANVNPNSLRLLKGTCRKDNSTDKKTVPLDEQSQLKFDNNYFGKIKNNATVLESDHALYSVKRTSSLVDKYIKDQDSFFKDFVDAMVRMGNIGVITDNKKGEIRKNCGTKNKIHK